MEPITAVDPTTLFSKPDFYITVLAVVTVVTLIKHSISIVNKSLLDTKVVKLLLEWSGPLLGGASAFVPGLWDEYTTMVGVMVAAPCGFLSERLYKSVLKKLLPGGIVLSSDHRESVADSESE
jgi:hypothetical protein